jgi:hypothetical protein
LTHLTLTIPNDTASSPDKHLETLVCLALKNLRLIGGWGHRYNAAGIMMVLDSIAPCTTTRTIRLGGLEYWSTGSYDPLMLSLATIDDILIRKFPHLQRVGIKVEWYTYSGGAFPDEEAFRRVMPGLEKNMYFEAGFSVMVAKYEHIWMNDKYGRCNAVLFKLGRCYGHIHLEAMPKCDVKLLGLIFTLGSVIFDCGLISPVITCPCGCHVQALHSLLAFHIYHLSRRCSAWAPHCPR